VRILDPGHLYELPVLDGDKPEILRFVKRCFPAHLYPGNTSAYPGTTSQQVIKALLDRAHYVQGQFWCIENALVSICLRIAFWALEFRAARRHGKFPHWNFWTAIYQHACPHCLHLRCAASPSTAKESD
jgi:hypothetical protein